MIDANQPVPPVPPVTGTPAGARPRYLAGPPLAAVLASLNHLLAQQAWARDKLSAFAGRGVAIGVEPASPLAWLMPPLRACVTEAGLLQTGSDLPVDVSLWLKPSPTALFDGVADGPAGLQRHLRVEGDAMMAATLGELARHLRWDAEEDLSRVVGDIAAHRVFKLVDGLRQQFSRDQVRARQTAVEYFTAESGQLTERSALDALSGQVAQLGERLDQLARRVSLLSPPSRGR